MNIHRNYILPKWGKTPLSEMSAMAIRSWILNARSLKGKPLSGKSKGNIMGQMSTLFRFAMLWDWVALPVNPCSLFTVPGVSKRIKKPRVIPPATFRAILDGERDVRFRAMLLGAYCLGLRVSELFGLKWSDLDHLRFTLTIQRAIVDAKEGDVKTERSGAPLPISGYVEKAFRDLRQWSEYNAPGNWIFASEAHAGRLPLNSKWIQQTMLLQAGRRLGLDFNLGWHTFRHSYKVLLERAGVDLTVQRDLMRHADTHTTSQIYGEVEMDRLRSANEAAMLLIFQGDHLRGE